MNHVLLLIYGTKYSRGGWVAHRTSDKSELPEESEASLSRLALDGRKSRARLIRPYCRFPLRVSP